MGTSNPKVSAYVPQAIKDRLTEFREERKLSESQAVTAILAEYFQIEQSIDRSDRGGTVGGVTLGRVEALEERLANFAASVEQRLQQLGEEIRKTGEPSVVHQVIPDEIISESEQSSSLLSEPQLIEVVIEKNDELPASHQELEQVVDVSDVKADGSPIDLLSELHNQAGDDAEKLEVAQEVDNSVLPSEPLNQGGQEAEEQVLPENTAVGSHESKPELSLLSEPLNNLISKPLPGKIMAKRLSYHPDSLSKAKTKTTDEEFLSLSAGKDPDGIAWKFIKKGRGYLPANELSSELQDRVLSWLKENFPEHQP